MLIIGIYLAVFYSILPFGNTVDPVLYTKIKQTEEIFLQTVAPISNSVNDHVCSLNIKEKISLCEHIFTLQHYKQNLKINIGKIAFFMAPATCEVKQVKLKLEHKLTNTGYIAKRMYPCYGKHNPIETSFIEDSYYTKFYLSSGPSDNSVIVYEYNSFLNKYTTVYEYLLNMEFSSLNKTTIRVKEVTAELAQNTEITVNSDPQQVEYILVKEDGYYNEFPVCEMESSEKIALCRLIYNRNSYKNDYQVDLHEAAFRIFELTCIKKSVKIQFVDYLKETFILKYMYPCFSRKPNNFGFSQKIDEILKPFYVSDGPRRNSVLVYSHTNISQGQDEYVVFEMYENIGVHNLKSESMTIENIYEYSYYNAIRIFIEVSIQTECIKMEQIKIKLEELLQKEMKRFEDQNQPSKKQYKQKLQELISKQQSDFKILDERRCQNIEDKYEMIKRGDKILTFNEIRQQIINKIETMDKIIQKNPQSWDTEVLLAAEYLKIGVQEFFIAFQSISNDDRDTDKIAHV